MPKIELTPQQRRALRAAAHPLHPVVLIGDNGLTEPVLAEIDRNLTAHELIKVHVAGAEREARDTMLASICEALSCAAVHHIGKTLIIYRPRAQAQAAGEDAPRTGHRKSGPYVPKKLAAYGHDARKPAARRKAARGPTVDASGSGRITAEGRRSTDRDNLTERPARPTTRSPRSAAPHGIPRRSSGSALTLRAGRRGRSTRS